MTVRAASSRAQRSIPILGACALFVCLGGCDKPLEGDAFWLNWWVTGAAAIATLLAIIAAITGPVVTDILRAKWFPPKLTVMLRSKQGEPGINKFLRPDGVEQEETRRFYHLKVSNGQRHISPAEDVQVSLLRLEEPGPGGTWQTAWDGEMPLTWRNQQISPLQRTIGADYDADLFSVGRYTGLGLALLNFPFNLAEYSRKAGGCHIRLTVQAKGKRNDSPIYQLQIAWDGNFHDATSEMLKHVVIT